ncbi:MAG TPA: sensor histidine kinase [Azospira sp.]|nr:sensor histidine kinase [Azospira sp.]HNN08313.1 sensor histidine kinase [Azospira sp.]HNN47113.1 sensor histidine kinase [Azospira sp.]
MSPWRTSLRSRLVVGTLCWVIATVAIAGWALGRLFREHVAAQFHAELRTHLDQLTANIALDANGRPLLTLPLSDPRLSRPYSGCYWQVDGFGQGEGLKGQLRSRSLWDHVLSVPQDKPADGEIHQHRIAGPDGQMLGMVERTIHIDDAADGKSRSFRLIAAADETQMTEPVERFHGVLWLSLGVLVAGLALAVLMQVVVGLAPLGKLRRGLERIGKGEAQRIEGDYPAEIAPLVDEFNSVLEQNAAVVERARTQAGNLAHALKTPLSILANSTGGLDDPLARTVREQVAGARRQIDYHLARAQAAANRLPGTRTALAPVIDGLMRAMHRLHAEQALDLAVQPMADAPCFHGDVQDLQEMLGNLLENACKWARHRVEVNAGVAKGVLWITIDDDGKGLPAAQRSAVLQRGVRADEQVPGSGLGLAIVSDLAQLYGGSVSLEDSPLGGLRARLTLPAAP